MTLQDYDLPRWRRALAFHKRIGTPFEEAWLLVVGPRRGTDERSRESVIGFVKRHWQAAYTDSPAPLGRFAGDEPCAGGTGTRAPVSDRKPGPPLCRSGVEGGCRQRATRGRFGPTFCAGHHAELVRLTPEPLQTPVPINLGRRAA